MLLLIVISDVYKTSVLGDIYPVEDRKPICLLLKSALAMTEKSSVALYLALVIYTPTTIFETIVHMRVSEIMVKDPVRVSPDISVAEIARLMNNKGISSVVLVRDDQAIGIVTERDLVRRVLASGKDSDSTKAFDICTRPVATTSENADLELAVDIMNSYNIRRLVIVDKDNRVVGIVTTDDIWRNFRQLSEELAVKYMAMSRHR